MARSFALALFSLALALIAWGCDAPDTSADSPFASWARASLVPFEGGDLEQARIDEGTLRNAVGGARLVGLGESRHDTREQFLVKAAVFRQLVEELGFRALVLEESLPHARALDRYVTLGEGELDEVMSGLAGWYLWDLEEMHDLVAWIRAFNERRAPGEMVRVFGVDITAPAPGVREVLAVLDSAGVATTLAEETLGLELQEGDHWPATWERYRSLTAKRRDELLAHYDDLVATLAAHRDEIVSARSELGFERLLQLARIGREGNALFLTTSLEQGGEIRERGMADALLWIMEHEIPEGRAMFWAHNLHVARAPFEMPGLAAGTLIPCGVHLDEELGEDYLVIGAAFGRGSFDSELPPGEAHFELPGEEVLDGALARLGESAFLLDLRHAEQGSGAATWLAEPRGWRAQGGVARLVAGDAIDMVFFVDEITRARPSARALERFARR